MRKKQRCAFRFLQSYKLYEMLPMKQSSILPDEGFAPRALCLTTDRWNQNHDAVVLPVSCKPKPAPGTRWGHRVMVHCSCGRLIPFGRMCQHWPTHEEATS